MANDMINPRALADQVFEAGSKQDDIADALGKLGDDRAVFLSRLAIRAALARGEDDMGSAPLPSEEAADLALLRYVEAVYERENIAANASTRPTDLANPATWATAMPQFGGDTTFVVKLAGRNVSVPTNRFLRYAADVLGVAMDQVRQHFSSTLPRGLVGAEHKSSGKPQTGGVEEFADAVRAANIPSSLKARWLEE